MRNTTVPILSIITVTKNCASTIYRTIDSVIAVINQDIEYIIIDGNSTDGTLQLIRQNDDFIDYLISEEDSGIYNAMNKGIGYAHGKYILFLNGDDEIVANDFSKVLSELSSSDSDVCCAITMVEKSAENYAEHRPRPWSLLFYNSIPHPSAFISSKLIKNNLYREDLGIASDYDFFLRVFLARKKFKYLDYVTAIHHKGGASSNIFLSEQENLAIRMEHLGYCYYLVHSLQLIYRLVRSCINFKYK